MKSLTFFALTLALLPATSLLDAADQSNLPDQYAEVVLEVDGMI